MRQTHTLKADIREVSQLRHLLKSPSTPEAQTSFQVKRLVQMHHLSMSPLFSNAAQTSPEVRQMPHLLLSGSG